MVLYYGCNIVGSLMFRCEIIINVPICHTSLGFRGCYSGACGPRKVDM